MRILDYTEKVEQLFTKLKRDTETLPNMIPYSDRINEIIFVAEQSGVQELIDSVHVRCIAYLEEVEGNSLAFDIAIKTGQLGIANNIVDKLVQRVQDLGAELPRYSTLFDLLQKHNKPQQDIDLLKYEYIKRLKSKKTINLFDAERIGKDMEELGRKDLALELYIEVIKRLEIEINEMGLADWEHYFDAERFARLAGDLEREEKYKNLHK